MADKNCIEPIVNEEEFMKFRAQILIEAVRQARENLERIKGLGSLRETSDSSYASMVRPL